MLNLNDDMDDLIRQAADDYPLKINGDDWDKVAGSLEAAKQIQPANNKKYWWLLLLLLPLMIAIPVFNTDHTIQHSQASSNTKKVSATENQQNAGTTTDKNNKVTAPTTSMDFSASATQSMKKEKKQTKSSPNHYNLNKATAFTKTKNDVVTTGIKKKINENSSEEKNINKNNTAPVTNATSGDTYNNKSNNTNPVAQSTMENTTSTAKQIKEKAATKQSDSVAATNTFNNNKVAATQQKDSAATVKKTTLQHTTPVKTKGIYIGIAAGLDASTVKWNKINKTGYDVSFIAGYRISNNWSVESGLMWDDKNYYSPGEYFDKSRTDIPAASYIHFLNGACRMYEVPLNVKYDFNSKKLSGFYVAAGLSSYIMKKENYEYHATYNGMYYIGNRAYKNSTNNLFSVANINGGYQFIFKNNTSLRIEPYFKIPLNGLGIGKLPFSSTGISAAYTLPLH